MNRQLGMICSAINLISVICFALSMLVGSNYAGYFSSMWIAFSFVPMMCAYAYFSKEGCKLAGYISMGFAAMYGTIIVLVYFAQLTTVHLDTLTPQAAKLLDFQQSGLLFSYDLLGYGLMALSTFFAGLTIPVNGRADKWLKLLLLIHGGFFFMCLLIPMLGVFQADSPTWIGVVILEFWCAYFAPISVLSFLHFSKKEEN